MVAKQLIYILIGVLILSLVGCVPESVGIPITGIDIAGNSLAGTHWKLITYGQPGSEVKVLEGKEPVLQFEGNNQANGSGGCNMFGAEYEESGENELAIHDIVTTPMSCSDADVLEQEATFLDALRSAESFELAGDVLLIHYGAGHGVLHFLRIAPSNPGNVHM